MGRDIIINQTLRNHHLEFGLTLYNIVSISPLEIGLSILALKLGFSNKIILSLIIAFLI